MRATLLGLVLTLAACGSSGGGDPPIIPSGCEGGECSFCNPDVWGGSVPDATSRVTIPAGKTVVMDCSAEVGSLTIEAGGTLFASRTADSALTLHGNLVDLGTVDYGDPAHRLAVKAEIIFTGMHDDAYVGTRSTPAEDNVARDSVPTPMTVVEGDTGLWVMGQGKLLAAGQEKRAWGTLTDGAGPGDPTFTVDDASGWQVGDRVVLTATGEVAASDDFAAEFDEGIIAAVDGNQITLEAAPTFSHAGCADCLRRGEAANLSRNVIIRSADDSAHAHVMIAEQGLAQLDSVELRWLGPEACGAPPRRAPLWFHQQDQASDASFLRHLAIWGGQSHYLMIEKSHGIEVEDLAGYDAYGTGFALFYDTNGCGTRCTDRETAAPKGTVFKHLLAAKLGVNTREDGCARINHRMTGISGDGGEGSGVLDSVAVGIGWEGSGDDVSGFMWGEGGTGRPVDFVFQRNVTHDSRSHGALVWHNADAPQAPYTDNAFWSVGGMGIHWGAYVNPFVFERTQVVDTVGASIGVKAIPADDRPRMSDATVDDLRVLAYVFVQDKVATFKNLTWSGRKPIGVTQIQDPCVDGNEDDPADPDCVRVWLRFEDPVFPAGVVPFQFGQTRNRHSLWEVRGFASPDYPDLPANFDLYRADNQVAGGSYYAPFDAWLVPR